MGNGIWLLVIIFKEMGDCLIIIIIIGILLNKMDINNWNMAMDWDFIKQIKDNKSLYNSDKDIIKKILYNNNGGD